MFHDPATLSKLKTTIAFLWACACGGMDYLAHTKGINIPPGIITTIGALIAVFVNPTVTSAPKQ